MKKHIISILLLSTLIICFIGIILSVTLHNYQIKETIQQIQRSKQNIIKEACYQSSEYGYFEGQKDALNNDIRIQKNQDGRWMWIKSPWECGKKPTFDPSTITDNPIK